MASYLLLTLILTCTIAAATATGLTGPTPAGNCYEKKLTLSYFIRGVPTGPNPTSRMIVPPLNNNPNYFGGVTAIDDEIRTGPGATSQLIGRAQGFAVGTSMESHRRTILLQLVLVFTGGPYNGSSFQVSGQLNSNSAGPFELSINGGTGKFRLALGYVMSTVNRVTGMIVTFGSEAVLYTQYN